MPHTIPEPWLSFLREVDSDLGTKVEAHCLGGSVLTVLWDLPRPTGDIDVIEVRPSGEVERLLSLGGESSELSAKYRLKIHRVTIAEYPENYVSRLLDITPAELNWLRLLAFEAHDLALAKLGRNTQRDREDVAFLVQTGALKRKTLEERFDKELRPYVLNEPRDAATLNLWLEEFFPEDDR
jgi:hypothetical protein